MARFFLPLWLPTKITGSDFFCWLATLFFVGRFANSMEFDNFVALFGLGVYFWCGILLILVGCRRISLRPKASRPSFESLEPQRMEIAKAKPWRLRCLLSPTSWMAYYRCECQKSGVRQLRLIVYPVIGFLHPRWCGISSVNSRAIPNQIFRRQVHHSPWSPSYAVICTVSNRERKIQEKSITHVIQKMYSETCSSNWRGEINRNLWNPQKPEN